MTQPPLSADRAVVTWEGPGEQITLTLYGADGEVAVPLPPKRALTLAQELLTRAVSAVKADSWDVMYGQGAPGAGPGAVRGMTANHHRTAAGLLKGDFILAASSERG